jgi:drug/metabolite transporter (DMT)-like permease
VVSIGRRWPSILRALFDRRALATLAASTALLSSNWALYVWAVAHERILETSIGYFINPLLSVLLGMVFLGERLNRVQMVAVALAALGVANLTWHYGQLPWIALYLAGSFGFYAWCVKTAPVDALGGLFIETLILLPAAVVYLLWLAATGEQFHPRQYRLRPGADAVRTGDGLSVAVVLGRGAAAEAVDRRLLPVYRTQHAVPARGLCLWRALHARARGHVPIDLDSAGAADDRRSAPATEAGPLHPHLPALTRPRAG